MNHKRKLKEYMSRLDTQQFKLLYSIIVHYWVKTKAFISEQNFLNLWCELNLICSEVDESFPDRRLYALVNSAAMNGVGPNTEISKIIFWPVTLSFVLAMIFWGSSAFCAVRWHRRRKDRITKGQPNTENL